MTVSSDLKKEAFVKEYIANGFNGKQAIKTINPNGYISEHSAESAASALLRSDEVQSKLLTLGNDVFENFKSGLNKAVRLCTKWIENDDNDKKTARALTFFENLSKAILGVEKTRQKSSNTFILPKRD